MVQLRLQQPQLASFALAVHIAHGKASRQLLSFGASATDLTTVLHHARQAYEWPPHYRPYAPLPEILDGRQHIGDFCDAEHQLTGGPTWLRVSCSWMALSFVNTFEGRPPPAGPYESWTDFYIYAIKDRLEMIHHLDSKWFVEEQLDPARLPEKHGVILIQFPVCPRDMQCFQGIDHERIPRVTCGREPPCWRTPTAVTRPSDPDQAGTSNPEDERGRPQPQPGDPDYREPWPDHIQPFEIDDPRSDSNRPPPQPIFFDTYYRAGSSAGCFFHTRPPGS